MSQKMKCPSCQRPIDHEASSCYSCNYSASHAEARFGTKEIDILRIHDSADALRVREFHQIEEIFDSLSQKFPQLIFAVYLGELDDTISLSELGFWLMNHGRVGDATSEEKNDHGILLSIDVETQRVGLSLGYLTEVLITEKDCEKALKMGSNYLAKQQYGEAVASIFNKLEKSLVKKARRLKRLNREEKRAYFTADQHSNKLTLPSHRAAIHFDNSETDSKSTIRSLLQEENA